MDHTLPYQHPAPNAGSNFSNLTRMMFGQGCDLTYLHKIHDTFLLSGLGIHLRLKQFLLFESQIREMQITTPPIFIIGHWRSGTTYIHNLISQDPRLGYLSYFQAFAPGLCLLNCPRSRYMINACLPEKRPMDNVQMTLDAPQEEEYGMANLSPYSFYHGWYFPRSIPQMFERYVLFQGVNNRQIQGWRETYLKLLKIATIQADGKQLVLKNPANTARVKLLLDLFPDAKFIHIYRDPITVYYSTKRMYDELIYTHTMQNYDRSKHHQYVLEFYPKLMQKYFAERHLIPPENLVEVKYEQFVQEPVSILEQIYDQFGLPPFAGVRDRLNDYVAQQQSYLPNHHQMHPEMIAEVAEAWKLTIEALGYEVPALPSLATV
jgi:omega-hydroxy-beta-dihydromenaquinone-9 sulfotransferase